MNSKSQALAFNATLMLIKTLLLVWLFGAAYTALNTNTQGAECRIVETGWFTAFYDGMPCRFTSEFYSMFLVFAALWVIIILPWEFIKKRKEQEKAKTDNQKAAKNFTIKLVSWLTLLVVYGASLFIYGIQYSAFDASLSAFLTAITGSVVLLSPFISYYVVRLLIIRNREG